MVVGEKDARASIHWDGGLSERIDLGEIRRPLAMGTHTLILVPSPACDSIESSPCTNRTRSPILMRPSELLARIVLRIEADTVIGDGEPKLATLHV